MARDARAEATFIEQLKDTLTQEDSRNLKSLTVSYNKDGSIYVTVTLMGSLDKIMDAFQSYDVIRTAVTSTGATLTLRNVGDSISTLKIKKSAMFKSISKELYDIYDSGIISTPIVSPITFPQAQIYLKECYSVYEDDGWRISEIFDLLELNISFPATWNYHVTQLSVKAGTPVYSFLQGLFPFPFLSVKKVGNIIVVKPAEFQDLITGYCYVTESSKDLDKILLNFRGQQGEVRYVRSGTAIRTGNVVEGSLIYTRNLVGGIFGVTHNEISDVSFTSATSIWRAEVNI